MRNANLPEFFGTRPNSVKSQSTASMRSGHGKGEYAPRGALCVGAGQMGSNDLLPYAPLTPEGKPAPKSQVRRVREEEHGRLRTYSPAPLTSLAPRAPHISRVPRVRPVRPVRRGPHPFRSAPPASPPAASPPGMRSASPPAVPDRQPGPAGPASGSASGCPVRARTTRAPPYSARGTATRAAAEAGAEVWDRTSHGWDSAHRRTDRAGPGGPSRPRSRSPRRTASPCPTPTRTRTPSPRATRRAGHGRPPSPPCPRGTRRRPRRPRTRRPVPRGRGARPSARARGGPRRHPHSCSRRRPPRR